MQEFSIDEVADGGIVEVVYASPLGDRTLRHEGKRPASAAAHLEMNHWTSEIDLNRRDSRAVVTRLCIGCTACTSEQALSQAGRVRR